MLTDGTISDPDNHRTKVFGDLFNSGVKVIIAARIGTDKKDQTLIDYANKPENAVADTNGVRLGLAIVERLNAEDILCNDTGNLIVLHDNEWLNKSLMIVKMAIKSYYLLN